MRALQGVDLTIDEGSFVVVIGTNGSGKSTLLNAVAGTFFVDAGTIAARRARTSRAGRSTAARRSIGRVFQNPFSGTAPNMTIAENLALAARRGRSRGPRLGAASRRCARNCASGSAASDSGLEDRLDNAIGSLSGGQRQALTLLMASWLRPELLLLDEHTAALDPKSADHVIQSERGHHLARSG